MPAVQHGGKILPLPDGKGFAELLVERGPPSKGATTGTARLLAYFYQADGTSVLAPAPSDVKVHLGSADSGTDVTLSAQTTPAGQFASAPGQFSDELRGQLELTLAGEALQAPFMFR
jgi:hypothetical protein